MRCTCVGATWKLSSNTRGVCVASGRPLCPEVQCTSAVAATHLECSHASSRCDGAAHPTVIGRAKSSTGAACCTVGAYYGAGAAWFTAGTGLLHYTTGLLKNMKNYVVMYRQGHHNIRNGIVWVQTGHITGTCSATFFVIEPEHTKNSNRSKNRSDEHRNRIS